MLLLSSLMHEDSSASSNSAQILSQTENCNKSTNRVFCRKGFWDKQQIESSLFLEYRICLLTCTASTLTSALVVLWRKHTMSNFCSFLQFSVVIYSTLETEGTFQLRTEPNVFLQFVEQTSFHFVFNIARICVCQRINCQNR